jgi:hypothetical protein
LVKSERLNFNFGPEVHVIVAGRYLSRADEVIEWHYRLLRCMSLFMALSGHGRCGRRGPLPELEQKWHFEAVGSASDPKQIWAEFSRNLLPEAPFEPFRDIDWSGYDASR